jgi:carbon storage regulator
MHMLVLSRKRGESIQIGDGIVITILDVRPSRARIGIDAPLSIRVQRDEFRPADEVVGLARNDLVRQKNQAIGAVAEPARIRAVESI